SCRAVSESRDRIDRRSGAADNRDRRKRQQKIPSLAGRGSLAESLGGAIVYEVHAQIDQREIVSSRRDVRGRDVLRMIAAHHRDISPLQPWKNRRSAPASLA